MRELSERLNQLKSRLEELENTPSELTKDALLADVRSFYDAVKSVEVMAVPQTVVEEPKLEEKEVKQVPEPVVEAVALVDPAVEKELEPTPESVVQKQEVPASEPIAETAEEETVTEKAALIGNSEDAPKANDEKILAGQLGKKPLEDLRTGIPLNEKFGIIRGLFNGNASDFGDAVLKLNNAASSTEMNHYLDLLKQRFGWNLESEAYQTFSVYVERKKMTLVPSNADAD